MFYCLIILTNCDYIVSLTSITTIWITQESIKEEETNERNWKKGTAN
jgi:hypothetical protein